MYTYIYIYIYIIHISILIINYTPGMPSGAWVTVVAPLPGVERLARARLDHCATRGEILSTRNRHLRKHRGFPVAFFQRIVNGIFQWECIDQLYFPKCCHLSSGCLSLEFAKGCSVACFNGIWLLWFWCVIFCPDYSPTSLRGGGRSCAPSLA